MILVQAILLWFRQWKKAGFSLCEKTIQTLRNCLTQFVVLSEEERLFQEYQFESTRQICLKLTVCVGLTRLIQFLTQDYKNFNLQGVGDQASWEITLLKHFRLVQFGAIGTLAIICIASSSRLSLKMRSAVCSHFYILWLGIGAFSLYSNLFMELMLERQVAWSSIDRCDSSHITRFCPNVVWALNAVSGRIAILYGVNFIFFYIPFRFTIVFNMCFMASLLYTVIPLEASKDQIWSSDTFDPSIICGLSQSVTHIFISVMYAKSYANEVHKAFKCSKEIQRTKEKTKMVLGTLIPERVLNQMKFTLDGTPELFCEELPMVTVLFCSFNKKDVLNMASASEFFRHLSDTIGNFDKIVDEAGLCKVEHIGEDYVVASPIIQTGLTPTSVDKHYEYKRTAIKIAEVALALVKCGNASTGGQMSAMSEQNKSSTLLSRPLLHFSAGIHSGPLIGAVAGKKRRFYRLFGDTVNTAARMCQTASEGSVQVSGETQKLINGSDSFQLVEHAMKHVKGKGQMATFTVLPNAKPATPVDSTPGTSDTNSLRPLLSFQEEANNVEIQHDVDSPSDNMARNTGSHSSSITDVSFGERLSDIGCDLLPKTSLNVKGNSTPLGKPLAEACLTTDLELRFDSTHAHLPAVINTEQRPTLCMNTFVSQKDEEQLMLWDDAMKELSKELGKLSGKFRNARMEVEYSEAVKDTKMEDLKKQLLLTVFVHAIFFPTMFPVLRHSEPNFGEIWSIIIGIGGFLLLFHLGFWLGIHLRGPKSGPCWAYLVLLSPTVSALAMLLFFGLGNSPFALLGVVISIVMRHPSETPFWYLSLSMVMLLFSTVMLKIVLDFFEVFQILFFALILFVVVMAYFRLVHCRALRSTWKLGMELNRQSIFLDEILNDLMPSTRAKSFVQKRYSIMSQPMGNLPSEEESPHLSASSASFCVVDRSSNAYVLQSDLVGFTPLCQSLKPRQVVELLHGLWCIADSVLDQCKQPCKVNKVPLLLDLREYDVQGSSCIIDPQSASTLFKMDTVGDAYIVIAQLPDTSYETKIQVASDLMSIASATMNAIHVFGTEHAPTLLGIAPGAVKMRMGMALVTPSRG